MGATAYSFLGVKVPADRLKIKTSVRGCKHQIHPGASFCLSCGKATWVQTTDWIPEVTEGHFHLEIQGHRLLAYSGDYWIAHKSHCSEVGEHDGPDLLWPGDPAAVADELAKILHPLRLWDPALFGNWCVLVLSC